MQALVFKTFIKEQQGWKWLLIFFVIVLFSVDLRAQQKITKVVIDAGHGGKDPGAIGLKSKEKDIVLAIALKLGNYIETLMEGVDVVYTRKTDVFVELKERAEIANRNKADLMISIHVNSSGSKEMSGTSTFVMGLGKSDDNLYVAGLENSVLKFEENVNERYADFKNDTMPTHIVNSYIQTKNLEYSLSFAKLIQNQFRTRVGRKDLGIMQDNLVVLWYTTMPSVLIETGFISNPSEEKFLMSDQGQDYLASAIFRAFRDYKTKYDAGELVFNAGKVQNFKPDIAYHVQIKSSPKPIDLKSKEFKGVVGIRELEYGGRYNYVVGHEYEMANALNRQKQMRKLFPDAYLIATKNGKFITLQEAKRLLNEK